MKTTRDSDGTTCRPGKEIRFSFGIPPVRATGTIVEIDGKLWVETPDHNPKRCTLATFRRCIEHFTLK
jgi:hypothetical protein